MMQFSDSAPPPLPPNTLGLYLDLPPSPATRASSNNNNNKTIASCRPPAKPSAVNSSSAFSSASCMEQLLVHCAHAVDRSDASMAHQILWVLNTIAPPDGDSTQRLASAFLRSLVSRASNSGSSCLQLPTNYAPDPSADLALHRFSPLDLASFLDLTPFHRFGFSASNSAISDAVEGFPSVHIVDLSTTHCMQIPTLIDSLSSRPDGPPFIRLTVPSPDSTLVPPLLDFPLDELGSRLVSFARSRNVGMEFRAVTSDPADGFETLIHSLRMQRQLALDGGTAGGSEALIINCQMMLHYVPDETAVEFSSCAPPPSSSSSPRSMLLKNLRGLEPNLVTVVDEDVDLTDPDVMGRLRAAFNYLWIPYDAVDTFLPEGSERRRWYEAEVRWKVENVVAWEGMGRVERSEGRGRWSGRMRGAGFRPAGFGEEAVGEVKGLLDEHAAGWRLKEEADSGLVLTWKGHDVVFASAWLPS